MKVLRFIIGGNIGAGKSTVINELKNMQNKKNIKIFTDLEPINDMKPFLDVMYDQASDHLTKSCNIYMIQMVVATHFTECINKVNRYSEENPNTLCVHFMERSIIDAEAIFLAENLRSGSIDKYHADLYFRVRKMICPDEFIFGDKKATLRYIHLNVPYDICMERIRSRARGNEVNISEDYITNIHNLQNSLCEYELPRHDVEVINVDGANLSPPEIASVIVKLF